jgi:hypothetical protein
MSTYAVSDDLFGPNKDVLVTRLELTSDILLLHNRVVAMLEKSGAKFEYDLILKEAYRPHITVQGDKRIYVGDEIQINSVTIVDKEPNGDKNIRKVLKNIPL